MVWQDFHARLAQFTSLPDAFEENMAELLRQYPRMRHHACLALWCEAIMKWKCSWPAADGKYAETDE